jgi:hypothetical protein
MELDPRFVFYDDPTLYKGSPEWMVLAMVTDGIIQIPTDGVAIWKKLEENYWFTAGFFMGKAPTNLVFEIIFLIERIIAIS